MASLTRYSKGYKIRYRIYYPDGSNRVAFAYRTGRQAAVRLKGQAESLEAITRQNALTMHTAIPYRHWRLLAEGDLQRWFPRRAAPLQYDPQSLFEAYEKECQVRCTSAATIRENLRRAGKLLETFPDLARIEDGDVRAWQQTRAGQVARKTVNLEFDILRQLLDHCLRLGWRDDNPARPVKPLPWKVSRLPQALTFVQVQQLLARARDAGAGAPRASLKRQLYRLVVAGIFLGLRRGELQYLLRSDTNGRQVWIQGKTLPGGAPWVPKDREARVLQYPGIEGVIAVVFGEDPPDGYVFSPQADHAQPFSNCYLSEAMKALLSPLSTALTLHSLRHTFATWRLEMGDPLIRVRALMGHSDAKTLLRYAHVHPDPMNDLLPLLS